MTDIIKILSPEGFIEEKKYIFWIISDLLGAELVIEFQKRNDYKLILPNGKEIVFSDSFFGKLKDHDYIKPENIPEEILYLSNDYAKELPVIFGDNSFSEHENEVILGLDLPASVFFMISRWEETAIKEKDDHGRFPGGLSLAVKHGFIKRPVVDEYIGFLKEIIKKLDTSVSFSEHTPELIITCDVDSFEKFNSGHTLKMFAGHLIKRLDPVLFATDLVKYLGKTFFGVKDPYQTFDRIFSIAEKFNTKPVFFILTSPEDPYSDGWFTTAEKDIVMFGSLKQKNAEIGLHYGYFSLLNEKNIISEKTYLEKKYNIKVEKGRAHFLQFNIRSSFDILEKAGIKDDYSLGYSRHAGFRCGTGRAFKPWNIDRKQAYNMIEHPLIVMDTTLYAHNKLNKIQIKAEFEYFMNISKMYQTDLTILIHNSSPDYLFEAIEEVFKLIISFSKNN